MARSTLDLTKDELDLIDTWYHFANQVYEEFGQKSSKEEKKLHKKLKKANTDEP